MEPLGASMIAGCFVDIAEIGLLVANMLEATARAELGEFPLKEAQTDEQSSNSSPGETGIHLYSSIDNESGATPPGEYGAPIWSQEHGSPTGVDSGNDPNPGRGSWEIRVADYGQEGFQGIGGRCLDAEGWGGFCLGGFSPSPFLYRLAPASGTVCQHRHPDHRRGWLLQSSGFQRPAIARVKGHHVTSGASLFARPPPWR